MVEGCLPGMMTMGERERERERERVGGGGWLLFSIMVVNIELKNIK